MAVKARALVGPRARASTGDRHRVLIVDDDGPTRSALRKILLSNGFESRVSANGFSALRFLQTAPPPCIVLLDLWMPVMDGLTLVDQLRLVPHLSEVPLVLMSGCSVTTAVSAENILQKPFTIDQLLTRLSILNKSCATCRSGAF